MTPLFLELGASLAAGAATSVSPCSVPRYLALIGILARENRKGTLRVRLTFFAGVATAYFALAASGGAFLRLYAGTTSVQLAIALGFVASGVWGLLVHRSCAAHESTSSPVRSGTFLAGAFSSVTIAPCCAPVLVAFASVLASGASPVTACALVLAFLCGHLAPTIVLADGLTRFARLASLASVQSILQTVGAACLFALGIYYGLGA